ncbi:terminase large subunit [uncultured Oscillibacter sp.]|uniref:terminase large subunit n=1 Tax=uncultured Oscillibacter sp. TaxID=876091 RepID=UPI0025EF5656|nr:terminase TerL endonuclease subunit [uncultured Oscillibacter sp.]
MPVKSSVFTDREAGEFVCQFISRLPTTDTGKNFSLYDWQLDALMQFYSTMESDEDTGEALRKYWYLYLEIPKKNGKSELAAALGIYHLFADGELNAEVYICAADKDNASIVFNDAVYMLTTAPWTAKMIARGELKIIESRKRVEYRQRVRTGNGGYKWIVLGVMAVLSSESYSKHGYKPSCVIFDELHAQPNRDLWEVMTFGAGSGRRQPVWIVLTTAGDDPDRCSIGWEIHEKAVGVRDARRLRKILDEGGDPRQVLSLRHVSDEDMPQAQSDLLERDLPNWLPVLYGLTAMFGDDPDDLKDIDIWDEALWYLFNPSLGKHLKLRTVRLEAMEARRSEAGEKLFRWLRLNQWISVKSVGWIALTLYDKTQCGPSKKAEREAWVMEHLAGKLCYGGVDLSTSKDLTAFVLLFPPQPGLETAVLFPMIWRPGGTAEEAERRDHVPYRDWARAGFLALCDGDIINYTDVEDAIRWARETFDLRMVGFDPYLSRTITQRLEPIVSIVEIPQDLRNLSPAMKETEDLMIRRQLLHVHNTCFRWTFGNVRCYVDGNGNCKPMKNKSTGRIDPTVASIIAMAVWMIDRNQKPDLAEAMARPGFSL